MLQLSDHGPTKWRICRSVVSFPHPIKPNLPITNFSQAEVLSPEISHCEFRRNRVLTMC